MRSPWPFYYALLLHPFIIALVCCACVSHAVRYILLFDPFFPRATRPVTFLQNVNSILILAWFLLFCLPVLIELVCCACVRHAMRYIQNFPRATRPAHLLSCMFCQIGLSRMRSPWPFFLFTAMLYMYILHAKDKKAII